MKAYRRVVSNKGSAGVGGMSVKGLYERLLENRERMKYQLVVSDKSWKALKLKLKFINRKTTPSSFDERIHKLNEVCRGWLEYFRIASIQIILKHLDGWLRNRLRYCIWHHWKKPERKRKNLIRLGVDHDVNRNKKCSDFGKMIYSIFGNSPCSNFGNNNAVTAT